MTYRWWVVAIFGAWFVVSAFALSAAKHAAGTEWNFIIGGALILLGALWVVLAPGSGRWRDGIVALLGIWMAVSPWVYGFAKHHSKDLAITLIVGVLVLIGAGLSFIISSDALASPRQRTSA
jgi:hypothetical protein